MMSYFVRRLLKTIPTLLGVALLVFVLFNFVGGDPAYQILGRHASSIQLAELRREYGLDLPHYVQFVRFLGEILTFDFGLSYATKQPVRQMILEGLGPSLSVAMPAFFLTTLISIGISLVVVHFRFGWVDRLVGGGCVLGMSVPILVYILFGQYFFAFRLGLFPISGYNAAWPQCVAYVTLPALIWVLVSVGYDTQLFRAIIEAEITQDYVRTARSKGLSETRILLKHVLKNCMVPVMTAVINEIPFLVLGSFLLETFFSIPGLGRMTVDALNNSDFPVIRAMTIFQSLLIIFWNLVMDILYTVVDPRVKMQ